VNWHRKRGNFTELDKPEPINVYARSKLAGEQAVVEGAPDAIIARVNFYGWSLDGQRSLAEWIYNNLSNKKPIQGFTDVLFCPLHVRDLGELLVQMVDIGLRGLYHVVSRECLSKYDFACRLAKEFGFDAALVQAASWASAGLTAPRSQNLTLNSDKLSRALGHPPPGINEGLRRFYQQHQRAYAQQIRGYLN
jgi:dTDP-4-dehydrorhamnose reductase